MEDAKIESLLRRAPGRLVPPGLLDKLQADIPRRTTAARGVVARVWWQRWLPELAFAVIAMAGIVVIAGQANEAARLRKESELLRAAAADLEQLRRDNRELVKLRAQQDELEKLRRNIADLPRLRQEVARLHQEAEARAAVQAEVKRSAAAKKAEEPLVVAGDREVENEIAMAEALRCVNWLKQIGLAARVWAGDHDDVMPGNFLVMTNELNTPKVLICPGDPNKKGEDPGNWTSFSASQISFEMVTPGRSVEGNNQVIFVRCPIHGTVLLYDGSVQRLGTNGLRRCPPGATLDFYFKERRIF